MEHLSKLSFLHLIRSNLLFENLRRTYSMILLVITMD